MSRDRWNNRLVFVLAAVGSAAGLGNAWCFPYVCATNGGGAFLIPYFVALITAGIPVLILEFVIGHKFQGGAPTSLANFGKAGEILGWFATFISFVIVTYYSVIMAWVFDYLWYSFSIAWEGDSGGFFFGSILKLTDGPWELGGFSIPVLIGLVLTWISIYLTIKDGVHTVGKVVKWTVGLPVLLLFILAVSGMTLEGAMDGINYYLTPDFSKLTDFKVWTAAFGQIFFSLSVGFGVMIAYSSYLDKKSDITNNAFMTALANSGVSFLAGFAIFSTLGYMAASTGSTVAEVSTAGVGLAFVVYPEAISLLPFGAIGQTIFALGFFIALLTLGIDSAFSLVEGTSTAISDKFDFNRKKTTVGVILIGFVVSLVYATKGGLYWLDIVDRYINNFGILVVGFIEILVIARLMKVNNVREYINEVSDIKLGKWYTILLGIASPVILGIVLVMTAYTEIMDLVNKTNYYASYPTSALILGGLIMLLVTLLASVIFVFFKTKNAKENSEEA
ncbi:neurotransmitter:Na+ symporter, NSS family [Dethiosulfatibacter aminovorans DSM 17477]|uniref:Neurotransmitter:Na+ symporter, NSS family n=1 Tax=Dethiosulfatibacter aminovorans DSM 17477 TaxID=1121476 RepID=A0A1M6IDF2_9FIRM|nr:sodium-dependent transporter [Dethiosulfatibacter aminovorans]SHJ32469.1 neurotransmitter:Na+ symporter, NSS family [Dethiosulfatibacter aminovorans DSM 17477]